MRLSSSNCSREYNIDLLSLAIAGPRDEKANVTSTVDLAGNRPLEEMRDLLNQIGRILRWNNCSDPRESSGNRSDKPVRRRNQNEQPEWPLRLFGREKG